MERVASFPDRSRMNPRDAPGLVCEESAGQPPTFSLRHALGLRALPGLQPFGFEAGSIVQVGASLLHLLECQREVEDCLRWERGPRLVVELHGPLSFSERALRQLAPSVTVAQLERAVTWWSRWTRDAPDRFKVHFERAFVGVTNGTTVAEIREHLDGLRRHGLLADPLAGPAGVETSPGEGLAPRPADPLVQALLDACPAESIADRIEQLERALVQVGMPPKPRGKRLRLLPTAPEKGARRGHIREVELTRECNLACAFCQSRGLELRQPRERAARAITAVRAAAREGGSTLVLSGAEPTLEWYLEDLVMLARSVGFEHVVVETNAVALAEPGRAQALADAGVTSARVAMNSFDAALADRISEVQGAHAQTMRGTRALLDAGIGVELAVALLPSNRGELARLVRDVSRVLPPSRAKVEAVVARVVHAGPGLGVGLPVAEAARAMVDAVAAAQASRIAVIAAPGGELPPCLFEDVEAAAPVLRVSEGVVNDANASRLYARIPLCEGCGAREVCPGVRRGLEAAVSAVGHRVAAGARGLPPTGERKRVLREVLSVVPGVRADGAVDEQRVVRVNFHCNQACDFCFVSRELPAPEESLIEEEIAVAAAHGASLSLSGGEPTLNPRLLAYIARATELGIERLDLQTNAIKMSDAPFARALAAAGLKTAFVSLHGTTAATSDLVTRAPGTFVKTVQGIKNLLAAGVLVRLNFVLCGHNARELAGWPDYVAREFAAMEGHRVQINFSFAAASTHNVPRDTALLPRFSDVAWALEAALDRADALGMPFLGFDSQCGVPACFLPPRVRDSFFTHDLPEHARRDFSTAFRKGDACASCALTDRCYGVRTAYAEMYGTAELRPLPARSP